MTAPLARVVPYALLALCAACANDKGGNLVDTVKSKVVSRGTDQPMLTELKPGPYQPSLAVDEKQDIAQRRTLGAGYVRIDVMDRYLLGIRTRLLDASGVTGVSGRTLVVAEDTLNAYSTAAGNVYVPTGWIEFFDSEDEVAALLAHELSHVLLKHHSSQQLSDMQKRGVSLANAGIELQANVAQVSNAVQGRPQNNATPTASESQRRALHRAQVSISITDMAVLPAWNRGQEREADLLGIDLLIKAGYNPSAMTSMLAKLKGAEQTKPQDDKAREAQLKAATDDAGKGNYADALKGLFADSIADLSRRHPDTDERMAQCDVYQKKHYATLRAPAINAASWKKIDNDPRVRTVLGNFAKSFSAQKMLKGGESAKAYTLARQAVSGPTARESFTNWVASQAAEVNNAPVDARRYATQAVTAPEPVNAAFEQYVALAEGEGRFTQALTEADRASIEFGDAPSWKVTRIRLMRKLGNESGAKALERRCEQENTEAKKYCNEAGNTPLGHPARTPAPASPSRPAAPRDRTGNPTSG